MNKVLYWQNGISYLNGFNVWNGSSGWQTSCASVFLNLMSTIMWTADPRHTKNLDRGGWSLRFSQGANVDGGVGICEGAGPHMTRTGKTYRQGKAD